MNRNPETAEKLLRQALERLKLINGPDENCVIKEWKVCENHSLIHYIEDFLGKDGPSDE